MARYKMLVELPCFPKDAAYEMDAESGECWRVYAGSTAEYPLRSALAGYLWMIRDEYMERENTHD